MKAFGAIILLCAVTLTSRAQEDLSAYLATAPGRPASTDIGRLEDLVQSFSNQHHGIKGLHKVFQKLHAGFLRKYTPYATFDEVFTNGQFDCLTGTALFSHVLSRLGYPHKVIEMNYHIFLLVQTEAGEVLLETTDRFGGFVTDADKIAERINNYRRNDPLAIPKDAVAYTYTFQLFEPIEPKKIEGLLYFNRAVDAFNRQDLPVSAALLEKAQNCYPSARCESLANLLNLARHVNTSQAASQRQVGLLQKSIDK